MAIPIRETPILYGKDAERFLKRMKEAENNKLPKEEVERIKENYEKIKKISKVNLP